MEPHESVAASDPKRTFLRYAIINVHDQKIALEQSPLNLGIYYVHRAPPK